MYHRIILSLALVQTLTATPVDDAEVLLQRQRYAEAATKLNDAVITASADAGYAHYLRGVARAESNQYAAAITDCDAIPVGHAWQRKALFLKAQCMGELKRHQEAELIYSAEATRLFATTRKEKLAEALVALAQEITKPAVPGQSVSSDAQTKALDLYRKALELETGPKMREQLLFQTVVSVRDLKQRDELSQACDAYLREFDPDWRGLIGSTPPTSAAKEAGVHLWDVRQMLIEGMLQAGGAAAARRHAEDVLTLWKSKAPAAGTKPDSGDIEWQVCRSFGALTVQPINSAQLPQSSNAMQQGTQVMQQNERVTTIASSDLAKHTASLRQFLKVHPTHSRSAEAAFTLIQVLTSQGKSEEAVEACTALYDRADWPPPAENEADKRTPAERLESWRQMAFFQIGALRFATRKYPQAIEQWRAYIAKHPDGSLWQQAQARIMEAEFQLCLDAVATSNREEAAKRFDAFITAHPLDARCAQLLFLNGQWYFTAAQELAKKEAGKPRSPELTTLFENAIAEWARLIIKNPQSEEASLALYRTGIIQAEHLDRHEEALNTFQRLTWGGWKQLAAERAAMMPQRSLALRTPRTFRSNETAQVRVNVRNIEKLKVSRYILNLEDFFRSRHRLDGESGIGSLDIDLIQPDKTWEVNVEGYTRLKPIEQAIDVPFEGTQPGVCLIRVEGEDWQASTIVIRSDIDLIVQSAWTEALVFVQDRVKGTAVVDAEVLLSNGKEILGQGRTGKDGVFRLRGEMIRATADLCAYVRSEAGVAIQRLNLRGMTQEITGGGTDRTAVELSRRGYLYTDKSAYRAGDVVHFRGIIRDVKDGAYSVPVGREYEISITDDHKRVLRRMKSKLSDFGTFTHSIPLPASTPIGSYHITAKAVEGDETHEAWFEVQEFEIAEITAVIETKPDAVFRGDHVEGTLRVNYSWGAPLVDEPVRLRMPDGRLLEGKTDATGTYSFAQETTAFQQGEYIRFSADLPARRRSANHVVSLLRAGVQLVWDRLPEPALTGEPSLIRVKSLDHRGKPTAATVKITLSRLDNQPQNPVLSGLPGLVYIPNASAPTRVAEFTVQTDATTGLGSSEVVLQSAMQHELVAQTTDARGNVVESKAYLKVSGPEDTTKLRLFSDQKEINEGSTLKIDAHSRIAAPLALVTLAGEDMIEHRIIKLGVGHNELPIDIAAVHWPQFEVSVSCLDGDKLHSSHRGFLVKRPLKIEIQTPAQPVQLGETTEITLTTTDANGNPVAAELSLALASSALFAQYSDDTENIDDYFHGSLRQANSLRTGSNAGFQHRASSQLLTKDESGNVIDIADGAQSHIDQLRQMEQRERSVWYQQAAAGEQRARSGAGNLFSSVDELLVQPQGQTLTTIGSGMHVNFGSLISSNSLNVSGGGHLLVANTSGPPTLTGNLSLTGAAANDPFGGGPITAGNRSGGYSINVNSIDMMIGSGFSNAGSRSNGQPFAPDAQWHCPLVTDASGKVKVTLTAPGTAGAWRLSSRGCTVTTQVGQAEKEMTTKSEFMAEMRMPIALVSGDTFTPRLLLHGAPDNETTAQVTFETAGTPKEQTRSVTLKPQGSAEVVFDPVKAPDMPGLSIASVSIKTAKNTRVLSSNFMVLPYGESATSHALKLVSAPGETAIAGVPSQQLLISTFSSPLTLLQSMGHSSQTAASRLLSHVSAARASKPTDESPIRLLIAELQITQQDGGWTWQDVKWQRDSVVTSLGLWALVEARALGFDVEDSTIKAATAYLKKALAIIPPDEPDKAAIILHALACVNEADFSVANRMYRDRVKLNDPALAWLAAAFQRMNRIDEAKELLKALEAKPTWTGSKTTSRLSSEDDTAAIILYAAAKTLPGSALAKKAADDLLQQLGVTLGADSALQGLWTAALTEHFISSGMHQTPQAEEMKLTLNGEQRAVGNGEVIRIPTPKAGADGKFKLNLDYKTDKATPIIVSTFINEKAIDPKAPSVGSLPTVAKRSWLHEGLRHHDKPLQADSTSPVNVAAYGQRLRVRLVLKAPKQKQNGYVIIDEPLPGGCMFVPGSLSAELARVEQLPGMLRLWFIPGTFTEDEQLSYELMALYPGTYRIAHTRVSDACRLERFNAGPEGRLTILAPGKPSTDPYVMNGFERLELAELLFNEDALEEARTHLEVLRSDAEAMKYHERDIARMLLWIHTSRDGMDAKQVVELFEALSERHPDIVIPFDKILKVAAAYRQLGEFERAWLVYRATMESSFVSDAGVSAALETAGDFPGSAEHQISLWMEYPDGTDGLLALFSLAQRFQEFAANPTTVPLRPGAVKWTKNQLLERSRNLLRRFVTLHAKDELADDAAFSLANVFFDLKDYASVVQTAGNAATTFTKSTFLNNFHYMTALGRFWQYQFPEALAAAAPVAAGSSDDAPNARYITAQIYHAQGKFAEAVRWYEKVKDEFDDASESIAMLQEKSVKLPFATSTRPGQPVKVELEHRNVKEAVLLIYRVDLMKLQERQKDLSSVGSVNLSGITPQAEMKVPLGNGMDYAWNKRTIELPLKDEGAYLVICRGDSQMTSSLVLITTLDMEVHEDAQNGAVRVQVRDSIRKAYVADAEIAAYDTSGAAQPQKGRTDPRGAFNASGIHGQAVIVVKLGDSRYAVYRSRGNLMPLIAGVTLDNAANQPPSAPAPAQQGRSLPGHGKVTGKDAYLFNVRGKLDANNLDNRNAWSEKLKNEGKGVKAEKAFKK
ncbi:MAG: tetratricopeptide repeat protein [Prosthecobacter sp.]|uniref:MG2 domain-containing protein n=1 Tax=Prosthecobacter sp. TaxID=1965333 RepID=UPI0025E821B0|nr:tetratricopeptide repeat protein [Prosthecobacter sp.]MCF7787427.1 tetratricopeptide repeat protein [Prosthecobacter sp.]